MLMNIQLIQKKVGKEKNKKQNKIRKIKNILGKIKI